MAAQKPTLFPKRHSRGRLPKTQQQHIFNPRLTCGDSNFKHAASRIHIRLLPMCGDSIFVGSAGHASSIPHLAVRRHCGPLSCGVFKSLWRTSVVLRERGGDKSLRGGDMAGSSIHPLRNVTSAERRKPAAKCSCEKRQRNTSWRAFIARRSEHGDGVISISAYNNIKPGHSALHAAYRAHIDKPLPFVTFPASKHHSIPYLHSSLMRRMRESLIEACEP